MQEYLSRAALGKAYRVLLIDMDVMYAGFAGAKTGISHRKIRVQLRNLG